jgi:spermidine/putrescine transport system substrate-binding protein
LRTRTGPAADRSRQLRRRTLLQAGLTAALGVPLLSACQTRTHDYGELVIPTPEHPVRWPLSKTHPVIESGLEPEPGSVLRIYNYSDYLSPRMMKDFEAKYGVDIHLSTFNDADEALTKIASGGLGFDLYFPSYDSVGKLVQADLLRPLNRDYLTNATNLWPLMRNPWYDVGSRYTIPYTIYSTGIGWRTDMADVDLSQYDTPFDVFWDTTYRDNMAILDDWHTAMGMVLMRNGITDINTTSSRALAQVREQLLDLRESMNPQVTIRMYTDMPAGQYGLSQFWSGDAINMPFYLPKKTDVGVLQYWFPPDGVGGVDNDLCVCLAQGSNPVAAHYFMNQILDETSAGQNFGYTGYQPPLNRFTPSKLVEQGFVPENLATAIVQPSDFKKGLPLLELPITADNEYHQIWQEFKAGG